MYHGDENYDTIADWYATDSEDEEEDENYVEDTEYLEYLDGGGLPHNFRRYLERGGNPGDYA